MDVCFKKELFKNNIEDFLIQKFKETIFNFKLCLEEQFLKVEEVFAGDIFKIFCIEKTAYVFIGIFESTLYETDYSKDSAKIMKQSGTIFPLSSLDVYASEINFNPFGKLLEKNKSYNISPYLFFGYSRQLINSCIEFVDEVIPALGIKEINDSWQGIPARAVIYRIKDDNKSGFAIFLTENILSAHREAQLNINPHKMIECVAPKKFHLDGENHYLLSFEDDFGKIFITKYSRYRLLSKKEQKTTIEPLKTITYYVLDIFIKDKSAKGIRELKYKLLDDAKRGKLEGFDEFRYQEKEIKWKNEYLVYTMCQKIFGKNVIFQYRPFFLKTERGQLSLDIYIPKYKTAIEYQGLQHFEPVDFFGGESSLVLVQERDKKKKLLCDENGIKLIYINYNEEINKELIMKRVKGE